MGGRRPGHLEPATRTLRPRELLYVHVAGSVVEMVRRLGTGVAPGGTLLLVGHRPIDPATGAPTSAAGQVQVSVDEAVGALDPHDWDIAVAEERATGCTGSGVDAVVPCGPRQLADQPGGQDRPLAPPRRIRLALRWPRQRPGDEPSSLGRRERRGIRAMFISAEQPGGGRERRQDWIFERRPNSREGNCDHETDDRHERLRGRRDAGTRRGG